MQLQRGNATAADGTRIAWQSSGAGPALVCCHAMGADHSMWDAHRAALSRGHRLISFDQRGAGDSDHPPFSEGPDSAYTVQRFGDDLAAVLDALELEQAAVLGYSMGAIAALSFAGRWPQRLSHLLLVSAMASRLPPAIVERARVVEQVLERDGLQAAYRLYMCGALLEDLAATPGFWDSLAPVIARATPQGFKGCFRVTIDRPGLLDELAAIRCPTLILVGERDSHYLPEARLLERRIADARRIVVPGVGHPMHAQDPQAFQARVLEFLG